MRAKTKKTIMIVTVSVLCAALMASVAVNIYFAFFSYDSYLQSTDEIYIMEAGIIENNLEFAEGENHEFTYDFNHEN